MKKGWWWRRSFRRERGRARCRHRASFTGAYLLTAAVASLHARGATGRAVPPGDHAADRWDAPFLVWHHVGALPLGGIQRPVAPAVSPARPGLEPNCRGG